MTCAVTRRSAEALLMRDERPMCHGPKIVVGALGQDELVRAARAAD